MEGVLELEIDADSGEHVLFELVVSVSFEKGGFASGGWAEEDHFEDEVVIALHLG